jgi:cell division protein FtsQ
VKRPEGFDRPPEPPAEPPRGAAAAPGRKVRDKPKRDEQPKATASREPRIRANVRHADGARPDKVPRAAREARTDAAARRAEGADARARARLERSETRRFTRVSRRRRVTWLVIGGICVILVAVLAVAVFSPILALKTIKVEGASSVKTSAVRSVLDDQLGTPLALLDTGKIDRDLSQFTLIRSYVTEIVPPNTLVVRIVERQAIGALPDGSMFDLVDPAGVVLKTSATRAGLPIIDIGSAKAASPAFDAAVKVLTALPAAIANKVQTVSASTLDNVNLTLTGDHHTVVWGSADGSDQKAITLADLLNTGTCKSKPVINVTAPLNGACGPGQPTSTPTPTGTATPPAGG